MATLKESGEAWIAAGQAEYGQMLVDADAAIERQAKEISKHREHIGDLQGRLWSVKGTCDQARKDRDEARADAKDMIDLRTKVSI